VELTTNGDGWREVSAGVASNGTNRTLFAFGTGKGLSRAIPVAGAAPFDIVLPGSPGVGGHWANDQLTVQLANGDFLLSWNGYSNTFDAQSETSDWWDKWLTADGLAPAGVGYPVDRDGIRPAELLWRFSAASGSWGPVNKLDSALVGATDTTGAVQRGYCAQAPPWVGGFDRPELYADPWSVGADPLIQRLYMTTRCARIDDDSSQVFASFDSGATWQDSTLRLPPGMAAVTATSSGRLFILQGTTVYLSDDHGKTFALVQTGEETPHAGFDITTSGFPFSALGSEIGTAVPFVAPTALAALGPSSVLAVYPSVETKTVGGKPITRQVAVVVVIAVPKKENAAPFLVPLKVIRAKAAEGSVILASFITDTRAVENPASMLYWLETTSRPATPGTDPVTLVARYALFAGPGKFPTASKYLSDNAGFQTKNLESHGFGDYMKGTFYYDDGLKTLNFVPVWPQEKSDGTVKAFTRIVTLADGQVSPPPTSKISGGKQAPRAKPSGGYAPCDKCRPVRKP
jgi:hypothetical protein